jgi:hypothetical protein
MKQETPPNEDSRPGGKRVYAAEAAEAAAKPGIWFVLREWDKNHTAKDDALARTMAANIRHGRIAAFRPGGSFDAVSRRLEDGTLKVYVRKLDLAASKKATK